MSLHFCSFEMCIRDRLMNNIDIGKDILMCKETNMEMTPHICSFALFNQTAVGKVVIQILQTHDVMSYYTVVVSRLCKYCIFRQTQIQYKKCKIIDRSEWQLLQTAFNQLKTESTEFSIKNIPQLMERMCQCVQSC